jgi:DNA-binding cell septation regulator SpoVG
MVCIPSTSIRFPLAAAVVIGAMSSFGPSASARDFFSSFFNTLVGRPEPPSRPALGYHGGDMEFPQSVPQASTGYGGRGTAYCVRTCDGRYFPISANNEQSRAATCSSLCPASETKVFYGSAIDHATSDGGKPYSSLPNAFKYREQFVQGCTCNGKDAVGLASISIDDDKTIRKGDIVAGENGLIVANRAADRKRGGVADYTPAPRNIREKFERSHTVARN